MKQFKPQKVDSTSWRRWLKEALHLANQKLILNVTIVLIVLGLIAFLPNTIGNVVVGYLSPVLLGVFTVIAESSDTAKPVATELKMAAYGLLKVFGCALLLIAAMHFFAFIVTFGGLFSSNESMPAFQPPNESEFPIGGSALGALFFWLLIPLTWFVVPLLTCGRFSIRISFEHAFDALDANWFVWRVSGTAAVVSLLTGVWHGAAAVPMYPILGAMIYAAYRHIFLGVPPMEVEVKAATGVHVKAKALKTWMVLIGAQSISASGCGIWRHNSSQ